MVGRACPAFCIGRCVLYGCSCGIACGAGCAAPRWPWLFCNTLVGGGAGCMGGTLCVGGRIGACMGAAVRCCTLLGGAWCVYRGCCCCCGCRCVVVVIGLVCGGKYDAACPCGAGTFPFPYASGYSYCESVGGCAWTGLSKGRCGGNWMYPDPVTRDGSCFFFVTSVRRWPRASVFHAPFVSFDVHPSSARRLSIVPVVPTRSTCSFTMASGSLRPRPSSSTLSILPSPRPPSRSFAPRSASWLRRCDLGWSTRAAPWRVLCKPYDTMDACTRSRSLAAPSMTGCSCVCPRVEVTRPTPPWDGLPPSLVTSLCVEGFHHHQSHQKASLV